MKPITKRRQWRFSCLLLASAVFASLALAVALGAADDFDNLARNTVHSFASPLLTELAYGLSFLGSVLAITILSALTAAFLWWRGESGAARLVFATYVAAVIVNNAIKFTFARARPEVFFGTAPESFSFASGHAIMSACYFGVAAGVLSSEFALSWQRWMVWTAAIILIGGIGWSRVYLGVHYPSDVIAGFALAAIIVCTMRGLLGERD